jgi:putative peptide zinc metalloprotease protein
VTELGVDTVRVLEDRQLASVFGGPVEVRKDSTGRLIPVEAIYKIMLEPSAGLDPIGRRMIGTIVVDGDTRSILGGIVRRAIAVAMRESAL